MIKPEEHRATKFVTSLVLSHPDNVGLPMWQLGAPRLCECTLLKCSEVRMGAPVHSHLTKLGAQIAGPRGLQGRGGVSPRAPSDLMQQMDLQALGKSVWVKSPTMSEF